MPFKRGRMWYLDYVDETGKRHREPWSTSKEATETEEKKRKQTVLLMRNDRGQFGQIAWTDFKDVLARFLYPKRAKSTIDYYKRFISMVDKKISPRKLVDITPRKVEEMRLAYQQTDMGKHNLERSIRAGFAIFTWAYKNNYIHKIEWTAVENTHLKRNPPVFLTIDEFKRVIDKWNPANQNPKKPIANCAQLYLFALMCRRMILRPSEAWFARWELLDIENGEYHLLEDDKSQGFKVKVQSYRTIPVPSHLLEYLREIKKTAKSPYIIEWKKGNLRHPVKENGRPMKASRFFRIVSHELTALGFPKASAYSFRHTGATHMVVKHKQTLSTTGRIMGHKSERTTSIYVHPVTDDMREAIEELESDEYADRRKHCNFKCQFCPQKGVVTWAVVLASNILNKRAPDRS